MRRLFWVGVGAVGAVLAARRLEQTVRRYTPAGVAEQVEQAGRRTEDAARGVLTRFAAARAERERELVETLLVTPEGGDPGAVLPGRRRAAAAGDDAAGSPARPAGRVDDDEPLYDF
ncbi:hypothetical protein GXB85_07940 [Cellulomonas sp. APG4]|uniref:hypothetical protein n=1 Tax=Cellulomonas sp. APG4 TaxID=1538656 RepID=UPI001379B208|nr:hypothetical protein [Cellulomonas sp. APG4]NCT90877.1 hypothetical protein [Cellulomonas sp. APG4]